MVWFLWQTTDPREQWLAWILDSYLPDHVVETLDNMRRDGSFASFQPIMVDILHWVRIIEPDGWPLTEHWDLICVIWEWCEGCKCYTVDMLEYSVQFGSNGPVTRFWHVGGRSLPPRHPRRYRRRGQMTP